MYSGSSPPALSLLGIMAFLTQQQVQELVAEDSSSSSGRYLNPAQIEQGTEVRIRIMDFPGVTGYEGWTIERKPVRFQVKPAEMPENIQVDDSGQKRIKQFMAGICYDYTDGIFKCFSLTQITLRKALLKFCADEEYGDPSGYDIKIGRTGEKLLTTYTFSPSPPKAFSEKLCKEWEDQMPKCNLKALFNGEEVFS